MTAELFLLSYDGVSPSFASPPIHAGAGSAVLGRATVGKNAWLGALVAIRADGHYVKIGDDFRLGAGGTVHIAHGQYPTEIGKGVTAGDRTVIHACIVGDGCHFGTDVVILDGSVVEAGAAIADGSIVFPRSKLEGGWLYEGMPAKPVRRLEPGELDRLHAASREASETAPDLSAGEPAVEATGSLFVAATARLSGRIEAEGENGIWFGCRLDGGTHGIRIGANANIQDNTVIRSNTLPVSIGRNSTLGHNVEMTDSSLGDDSLIGMGAVVAPGTRIGNDVLLAAGAWTEEGQVLESGWLYGGRPARQLSKLDDAKRAIISMTWPVYCDYARRFAAAQAAR